MRAAAADNQRELAFMLDALRIAREDDRFAGTNDGRRRLQKDQRLFGHFVAELRGMRGIVPADADDLAGLDRSEQAHISQPPGAGRA